MRSQEAEKTQPDNQTNHSMHKKNTHALGGDISHRRNTRMATHTPGFRMTPGKVAEITRTGGNNSVGKVMWMRTRRRPKAQTMNKDTAVTPWLRATSEFGDKQERENRGNKATLCERFHCV